MEMLRTVVVATSGEWCDGERLHVGVRASGFLWCFGVFYRGWLLMVKGLVMHRSVKMKGNWIAVVWDGDGDVKKRRVRQEVMTGGICDSLLFLRRRRSLGLCGW